MARAIWKGALSFGLVYIPIELHPASRSTAIALNMLDRRDFSPVGYQRINKRTGRTVEWGDIVKGYQYKKGEYVALSEEDFRQANVKASETLELESFTQTTDIPLEYYDTPYYLVPLKGGEKGYTLLRETLERTGKLGIGSFVMRGRQHLAAIVPQGRALMLNTLRFEEELRPAGELELPPPAKSKVTSREIEMAERLVEEMTAKWRPGEHHDSYHEDLMKRIEEKIRKRQTHVLTARERGAKEPRRSAQVIDLMAVLRKSLEARSGAGSRGDGGSSAAGGASPRRAAGRPHRPRRAAARGKSHSRA